MRLRIRSCGSCLAAVALTIALGLFIPTVSDSRSAFGDDQPAAKKPAKPVANQSETEETTSEEPVTPTMPTVKTPIRRPAIKLTLPAKKVVDEDDAVEPVTVLPATPAETPKSKLPIETPTHEQIATIAINSERGAGCSLNTFCLTPDGKILAAVQCASAIVRQPVKVAKEEPKFKDGTESTIDIPAETAKSAPKPLGELRLFDADGKALDVWPLAINPSAVNVGADGSIYVAGSGKVLKLDSNGKILLTVDSPNSKELVDNREAILKELQQQNSGVVRSKEVYIRAIEQAKLRVVELEEKEAAAKKEEKELTRAEKVRLTSARRSIQSLEEVLAKLKEPTEEEKVAQAAQKEAQIQSMLEYKKRISGIAITDKDVFVACSSALGWGYDVWQLDHDLKNGTKIVEKLRGCCGQMDIQARGENLVVAENSMHRVCCYDRTGKLVKTFGERESISKLGFEGCCNPMNCRLGSGGEIYTSESSIGRIRKYSADGEYMGLVGQAKLISGCKHVAVAVSSDGIKVYLLDVTKGEILVMAKKPGVKTAAK